MLSHKQKTVPQLGRRFKVTKKKSVQVLSARDMTVASWRYGELSARSMASVLRKKNNVEHQIERDAISVLRDFFSG